jgi:hypothetical protein
MVKNIPIQQPINPTSGYISTTANADISNGCFETINILAFMTSIAVNFPKIID